MSTSVEREAMLSATCDLPSVRLSEIVLRTARYEEVKDWYQAVLGVDPYIDTEQFCFRRLHVDYPYSQVLAIFHVPEASTAPGPVAGLDHIQLRHASLEAMFDRFERLKVVGIVPYTSMNHGPGTSFYYRDPDQNSVELSGPNFDDEQEYLAYFESESYRNNIAGIIVDPDDFVGRYRSGTPQAELVKL
ncbi:MAG TPA: VOC family protein [Vicinamibacterales bacterium]|nr:VOC family protein [Vicinamibacterales bacterium]